MEAWGAVAPGLKLPALDHLEKGVNIQCTNCSDFIVGKQTNFNGPVTIISCADVMKQRTSGEKLNEELIIRDKILSQSAAMKMTKLAEEKEKQDEGGDRSEGRWQWALEKFTSLPKIPLFACVVLLLSSAIVSAVLFATAPADEKSFVRCIPIGHDMCIYSGFPWQSVYDDVKSLDAPLPYIIVFQTHHEFCYDFDECVRVIGEFHREKSNETGCSFFVGSEGNAYEDRGWGGYGDNSSEETATRALRVCFMGEFSDEFPTYPQVVAVTELIRHAVEKNHVAENYVLAASNATSPCDYLDSLYEIIKKWPNFSENPFAERADEVPPGWSFPCEILRPTPLKKSPLEMRNGNLVERYGAGHVASVQCEPAETDVNIQCMQSADFVLGKQTNFNCPVTIISCADSPDNPAIESKQANKENIIIRDKVLSKSAAEEAGKSDELGGGKRWQRIIQKLKTLPKIPVFASAGLLMVFAIVLVICLTTLLEDPSIETNGTYRFYTKKAWGGKPPKLTIEMKLPIPYVVVSHSVTSQCYNLKTCSPIIQNMQSYHMSIDFADIGYNFLVDSGGNVYEGRGWNIRNVKGGFVNGRNIDVCLIGDFSDFGQPTVNLMDGLKWLIEYGLENGKISKTYSLIAANSTYPTLSPGKNIYKIIKDWPHFDPDPKSHIKDYYE